jgi:sarcosine oxidase subunit alpha
MACRQRVLGGESVETQNVLGGRTLDLLRAADFIFPHGVDHHRLLAGIPGVSTLVTRLARRIAGLGRLPEREVAPRASRRREVEVLVIGGGRTGLAAAQYLGARAMLVDDGLELGGALRLVNPKAATELVESALGAGVSLEPSTTALGLYREPFLDQRLSALVANADGVALLAPRAVVLATGGHDTLPPFHDNDVPGVFSARGALELIRGGIWPGERVAIVGQGAFVAALQNELGSRARLCIPDAECVERVFGRQRVSGLAFRSRAARERKRVDAVLFDAPETPALELLIQAGGQVRFDPESGYVPILDADGRCAPQVFCVGHATGNQDRQSVEAVRRVAAHALNTVALSAR